MIECTLSKSPPSEELKSFREQLKNLGGLSDSADDAPPGIENNLAKNYITFSPAGALGDACCVIRPAIHAQGVQGWTGWIEFRT